MKKIYLTFLFCFLCVLVFGQDYKSLTDGTWETGSSWVGETAPPVVNIEDDIIISHYITRNGNLSFQNNGGKKSAKKIYVNNYLVVHGDLYFGADAMELEVGPEGKLVVFGDMVLKNKVTVANEGIVAATGVLDVNNSQHTDYVNVDEGVTFSGSTIGKEVPSSPISDMPLSTDPDVLAVYELIMGYREGMLPVDLLYFNVAENLEGVRLEWASGKEWSFSHYTVERSSDGVIFGQVGVVKGMGESAEINKYSLTDRSPMAGLSYYRLKAIDTDGKVDYKGLEVVNVVIGTQPAAVEVYPNPCLEGRVRIRSHAVNATAFSLVNSNGIDVYSGTLQQGQAEVAVDHLPSGIYVVHIEGGSKASGLRLFIR